MIFCIFKILCIFYTYHKPVIILILLFQNQGENSSALHYGAFGQLRNSSAKIESLINKSPEWCIVKILQQKKKITRNTQKRTISQ